MRKTLQSASPCLGLWLWWAISAAIFALSLVTRAVVRPPPFTDWGYIMGYSLLFPALFLGLLRLLALWRKG